MAAKEAEDAASAGLTEAEKRKRQKRLAGNKKTVVEEDDETSDEEEEGELAAGESSRRSQHLNGNSRSVSRTEHSLNFLINAPLA